MSTKTQSPQQKTPRQTTMGVFWAGMGTGCWFGLGAELVEKGSSYGYLFLVISLLLMCYFLQWIRA